MGKGDPRVNQANWDTGESRQKNKKFKKWGWKGGSRGGKGLDSKSFCILG